MSSSAALDLLAAALVTAQAEFPVIPKTHTADTGSYKYDYADLADIIDATRKILHDHDLAVTQWPAVSASGQDVLITRLFHSSGQWVQGVMRLPALGTTPQSFGSAITYARRYAYSAALGLATEEDTDGRPAEPLKRAARNRKVAGSSAEKPEGWVQAFVIKAREFADANGYDVDRLRHALIAAATDGERSSSKELMDADRPRLTATFKMLIAGDLMPYDNGQVIALEERF